MKEGKEEDRKKREKGGRWEKRRKIGRKEKGGR